MSKQRHHFWLVNSLNPRFCNLVRLFLQIWLPRIVQALLAAFADVKFFSLIRTLENGDVATWTVSFPLNGTVELKNGKLWLLDWCVLVSSSSATCARGSRGTAAPGLWPTAWRPPSPVWLFVTSPSQSPKHTAGLDLHHLWKIILLVHFLIFSFFPVKNICPWSPWLSSSDQLPWLSGFLCSRTTSGRKMTNWDSSLVKSFL